MIHLMFGFNCGSMRHFTASCWERHTHPILCQSVKRMLGALFFPLYPNIPGGIVGGAPLAPHPPLLPKKFTQHLHCIVVTSGLLSWTTRSACKLKVMIWQTFGHDCLSRRVMWRSAWRVGQMGKCCCTPAHTIVKVQSLLVWCIIRSFPTKPSQLIIPPWTWHHSICTTGAQSCISRRNIWTFTSSTTNWTYYICCLQSCTWIVVLLFNANGFLCIIIIIHIIIISILLPSYHNKHFNTGQLCSKTMYSTIKLVYFII